MQDRIVNNYEGKEIASVETGPDTGYSPTFCDIVFTDGSRFTVYADTVMYDQYSQSSCLSFKERTDVA